MADLHDYRQSYEAFALEEGDTLQNPLALFEQWFKDEEQANPNGEPNAMTLTTLGEDGFPKGRVVLLKEYSAEGFVFFTNYDSEKGRAIAQHPQVGLSFFWPATQRQVIVKGVATKVSEAESTAYFASRPRGSQLGAWASQQSEAVPNRTHLEERLAAFEHQYEGTTVPKPDHWGGYLVQIHSIEFWQGRANRLHDRLLFQPTDEGWTRTRLAP